MIYFLLAGDKVKIGRANDPVSRIAQLQTGCPMQMKVLLILPGGHTEERSLHHEFRRYRRIGEWFAYEGKLLDYITINHHKDRQYEYGFSSEPFRGNQQIKRLRQSRRVFTIDLAETLGISQQAVSALESREETGSISIKNMQRLARAMGYRFEYRLVPE